MKLSAHKVVFPKLAEEEPHLCSGPRFTREGTKCLGGRLKIKGTAATKAELSGDPVFYDGLQAVPGHRPTFLGFRGRRPLQEEAPSYRGEVPLPFLTAFRRQVSGRCYRPPQPGHPPPLG